MRKAIRLLFITAFICSAVSLKAATNFIKIHPVTNDTANEVTSYVSTSTIVPNRSEIHGYTVCSTRSNSYSPYVSLWDESASTAHAESNLLGETEATANTTADKSYPYPKVIGTQVKVVLGPYSSVLIEYVK